MDMVHSCSRAIKNFKFYNKMNKRKVDEKEAYQKIEHT